MKQRLQQPIAAGLRRANDGLEAGAARPAGASLPPGCSLGWDPAADWAPLHPASETWSSQQLLFGFRRFRPASDGNCSELRPNRPDPAVRRAASRLTPAAQRRRSGWSSVGARSRTKVWPAEEFGSSSEWPGSEPRWAVRKTRRAPDRKWTNYDQTLISISAVSCMDRSQSPTGGQLQPQPAWSPLHHNYPDMRNLLSGRRARSLFHRPRWPWRRPVSAPCSGGRRRSAQHVPPKASQAAAAPLRGGGRGEPGRSALQDG